MPSLQHPKLRKVFRLGMIESVGRRYCATLRGSEGNDGGLSRAGQQFGWKPAMPRTHRGIAMQPIKIIRNAPPPPTFETRGRKTKHPGDSKPRRRYPWAELNVGDAFDVPLREIPHGDNRHPDYNCLTAAMSSYNKKHPGVKFMARIMDDYRVRVWRTQ